MVVVKEESIQVLGGMRVVVVVVKYYLEQVFLLLLSHIQSRLGLEAPEDLVTLKVEMVATPCLVQLQQRVVVVVELTIVQTVYIVGNKVEVVVVDLLYLVVVVHQMELVQVRVVQEREPIMLRFVLVVVVEELVVWEQRQQMMDMVEMVELEFQIQFLEVQFIMVEELVEMETLLEAQVEMVVVEMVVQITELLVQPILVVVEVHQMTEDRE